MAVLIGVVNSVIGQVFAVASNGDRRELAKGDRLFAGETLDTGATGAVAVHLTNGKDLTLGRGSSLELSAQLLSDHPPSIVVHDQTPADGSQLTEVQQIQQAIAAGADPTQTLEATAAGPGAPVYTSTPAGDLGGGHSFVLLTETGEVVTPVVGFPTNGLGFEFIEPQLFVGDPDQNANTDGLTPVTPPVVVPPIDVPPVVTPPVVVPPDNGVSFAGLDRNGGEQLVYEADLPNGTNTAQGIGGDLSRSDVFSVVAPDGLASLTIDGVQVVSNGQLVSNTGDGTVQIVGPLGNTLTITAYDPATGVFNYTYVLSVDQANNQTTSNLGVSENFQLVATDTDGDTGNATLNVQITDDAPIANNDLGDPVTQQAPEISGNVVTNDFVGADTNANPVSIDPALNPGLTVSGQTIIGTYGTLTLSPSGAYTYVLNPESPAFQAYKDSGQAAQENFTYTLTDGDGDKATAVLTVNIAANNQVTIGNGALEFSEANLPDGTSTVVDKAALLTEQGSLFIDVKDGLASLSVDTVINGQTVSIQVVTNNALINTQGVVVIGASGNELTFTNYDPATGQLSYSYTLAQPVENAAPGTGDPLAGTQLSDNFQLVATDSDGDSASSQITVTITDDSPIAVNDVGDAVASAKVLTVAGDVLTNDKVGADANATPVSIKDANGNLVTSLQGEFGVLQLGSDGKYTYTLDPTSAAYQALTTGSVTSETFTYTLTDGDGDSTTATLTIDVKGDHGLGVIIDCDELVAHESNLPGGSTETPGGDRVDGSFTVDAPDGVLNLSVGGIKVLDNGQLLDFSDLTKASITTPEGNIFTVLGYDASTGTVQYAYNMTHALDNSVGDGQSITETFAVVAEDTDGDVATADLHVRVVDDTPLAAPVEATVNTVATGTNVLLVIDISDSMRGTVEGTNLTRLDLAKLAVDKMLLQYAALGDVMVQVTAFNNQAHQVSEGWVSVDKAIALVNALTAGNGTNYDYALDGAKAAFVADGKLDAAGTQNVSYFVSDGDPTLSSQIDHETPEQWMGGTDPKVGDGIDLAEEAVWKAFLELHDIKSYAIGIGSSPSAEYLDPIAYNGATNQEADAILVRNIAELPNALSGTVNGSVNGTLTAGGGFGADGGFVQSITVDGVKYSFDGDKGFTAGSNAVSGDYAFQADAHRLMVSTQDGGALTVNMLTGVYSYVSPTTPTGSFTETVLFTLSDNDGDVSSNALTLNVLVDTPVIADAQNIITNSLDSTITVPAAALLDGATAGTVLTSSTTFDTGWNAARAADFTGTSTQPIAFRGQQEQLLELTRSQFVNNSNTAAMTAALVVAGALGMVGSALASDTIEVELKKGETVHLDSVNGAPASLAWAAAGDQYTVLGQDGNFTAAQDGLYKIQVTHVAEGSNSGTTAEDYSLKLTIDYSHAENVPVHTDTYSVADSHNATASGAVAIHYLAGDHLVGTDGNDTLIAGTDHSLLEGGKGDDVLVAGQQGDDLYGNDGNDLLISGAGDDVLDGGAGNNTASYQTATGGVRVDLTQVGVEQDTGAGGHDTLSNIQNLIGSSHDDVLIGDIHDNILIGGKGDDTLTGGGGSDTLKWLAGDTGHDTVTDFKFGVDTLDLSQLLKGENSLDNFLQFKVTGSGSDLVSTIEISSQGNDTTTQSISLNHVDVASNYGVQVGAGGMVANGQDTATIISGMLNDHSLKADTV